MGENVALKFLVVQVGDDCDAGEFLGELVMGGEGGGKRRREGVYVCRNTNTVAGGGGESGRCGWWGDERDGGKQGDGDAWVCIHDAS